MQATIVNRTKQTLAVLDGDYAKYIAPNSTEHDIPPSSAEKFKERKDVAALIKTGKVRVLIPKDGSLREDPTEAASEAEIAGLDTKTFLELDWKLAVAKVNAITDLDVLEELFAQEDRARVIEAIEKRIRLLADDKTEIEIGEKAKEVTEKAKGKGKGKG